MPPYEWVITRLLLELNMASEQQIVAMLEQILETECDPAVACAECPEGLAEVRERLRLVRRVDQQLSELFPKPDQSLESIVRAARLKYSRQPDVAGYDIEGILGEGGMGVVYKARHRKLNRVVALKMLRAGQFATSTELTRFSREFQSIAELHCPNIVQIHDVGEVDGRPFFTMEYVEGGSLSDRLNGAPQQARKAAELVAVLAEAIQSAHYKGIIHRDLKPANILLSLDGTPKIADFGLARHVVCDHPVTVSGAQLGTPSYMSPEQTVASSGSLGPSVDIYALGAILYEMLTGRPPFRAETVMETQRQVLNVEPVPPARINVSVPRDLETICLKCLQKDPSRRYRSAAEVADDLQRFTRGEPILARPVGLVERTVKWCRRRPSTTIAIAISIIAMTGAVAGGIWLNQVEHARHIEEVVRREGARRSIESALPLLSRLVTSRQWSDAMGVLSTARTRLKDAQLPELDGRLAAAAEELEIAEELDVIRQSFPEPDVAGYAFLPARDAYAEVFCRVGIGSDIGVETAALRVRESPLCEELLIALDHAAFTERLNVDDSELERLLAVGRSAAPSPWQHRFRDPSTWRDISSLQQLVKDASSVQPAVSSYQIVMVGILLSSLGETYTTIEILREAQLREPSDFWVNLELGHALSRNQKHAEALQFYRAAVALRPNHYVAWTELGLAMLASGKSEDAIPPLRKAIALRPEYPTSWHILIGTLAASGRWDEAVSTGRDAVSANPTSEFPAGTIAVLQLCQARSAAVKCKWPIAADSYAKAIDGKAAIDSHALFECAAAHVLAGDQSGYEAVCASMRERCESNGIRRFLVARACTLATISDTGLTRATELGMPELDQHADSYWSLTQRGALLCRKGQHGEAISVLKQSLLSCSSSEDCIVSWVWLSRAHLSLGEHDAARMWLDKAAAFLDRSVTKPRAIHLHNWLEAQILLREVETELDS